MNERDVKLLKMRESMTTSEIRIRLEHVAKHLFAMGAFLDDVRMMPAYRLTYDDDYRAIKAEVEYILKSIKKEE